MQKWYAVLAILVLSLAEVQAEIHAVNPIQSARTSPSDCWGCCCNSSGSLTMNPSAIGLNSCTYQGGYCMGNARKGAWIFQIPELDAGSEITYMRFSGNRTGSWGSGYVYYKWVTSSDLNQTAISNAMSSADHWGPVNWTGAGSYSFSVPETIYAADTGGYLIVAAGFSSTSTMNLTNTGDYRARLVFLTELACPSDFDSSGSVDVTDVLALLSAYGSSGSEYDLDGDNYVGVNDPLLMLDAFGECP